MKKSMIILGSGPAGCTAAIYATRAGIDVKLFTGSNLGGQLAMAAEVENYPGFLNISGTELMHNMLEQAKKQGAQIICNTNIVKITTINNTFQCLDEERKLHIADSVIIATGASAKWLHVPNEQKFIGKGVSCCATCDGAFFKDQDVLVVGGGNTALTSCLYLANIAKDVKVVHRKSAFRAEDQYVQKAKSLSNVSLILNSVVTSILGESIVSEVEIQNITTTTKHKMAVNGVFIAIGHSPNSNFLKHLLLLDDEGYILCGSFNKWITGTSMHGIFAAGDVMDRKWKQVVTAANFGYIAATEAIEYMNN